MQTKNSTKTMPDGSERTFKCTLDLQTFTAKVGSDRVEELLLRSAIAHDFANAVKDACITAHGLDGAAKKPTVIAEHKALWARVEAGDTFDMAEFFGSKRSGDETSQMQSKIRAFQKLAKERKLTPEEKEELSALNAALVEML